MSGLEAGRVIEGLRGQLIVSVQADAGDPMDDLDTLTRMARAVLRGGAGGLRAEGAGRVAAFRQVTGRPIVGLVKVQDDAGRVWITPDFHAARAVAAAGADVVAIDCTARRLLGAEPWTGWIGRVQGELGKVVCADVATLEDGLRARDAGADLVATTLFGYTEETDGERGVAWDLLRELVGRVGVPVILEGHVGAPEEVREALRLGAHAVVVGSAITRPQAITARFAAGTLGGGVLGI